MASALPRLDPQLRRAKEAFVSNLSGTTKWEVFCVLSSLPLCVLIAAYAEARLAARARAGGAGARARALAAVPKLAYEYAGVVVPQLLLSMSVAPAEPAFLLLFLLWGSLALKLWMKLAHSSGSRAHLAHMLQHLAAPRKRFISAFRGGVMAATCSAILAVDFAAFPRRYAKAEAAGCGLMDVGVGAIIFAGGLVSAAGASGSGSSSGSSSSCSNSSSAGGGGAGGGGGGGGAAVPASAAAPPQPQPPGTRLSWAGRWLAAARGAALPLLLGCGRNVATRVVGYQSHVGEYGLSWNFFHTIACVGLLSAALPVPPGWLGPLGLGLAAAHQLALSTDLAALARGLGGAGWLRRLAGAAHGGLAAAAAGSGAAPPPSLGAWLAAEVPSEARAASSLWVANKEGIASLPGYWALFLLGAAVGHHLATSSATATARARAWLAAAGSPGGRASSSLAECSRAVWSWVGACWLVDLGLWALLAAVEAAGEPVSRRSCNLPYVLWTAAQCLAWLLLVLMADLLTSVLCSGSGACATASAVGAPGSAAGPPRSSYDAAATAAGSSGSPASCASTAAHHQAAAAGAPAASVAASAGHACGASGLQRRTVGRRGSGSSPTAAAAASAAAAAAAGGASSSGVAGAGSRAAAADGSSSREAAASPRRPVRGAAVAASGGSSPSSSSGSGPGTPGRLRRGGRSQPPEASAGAAPATAPAAAGSAAPSSAGPMRLLLAFNRNMLGLFLAANVMTGAVNLGINTLTAGPWAARGIVGAYMLALCLLAVALDSAGVTLKPW